MSKAFLWHDFYMLFYPHWCDIYCIYRYILQNTHALWFLYPCCVTHKSASVIGPRINFASPRAIDEISGEQISSRSRFDMLTDIPRRQGRWTVRHQSPRGERSRSRTKRGQDLSPKRSPTQVQEGSQHTAGRLYAGSDSFEPGWYFKLVIDIR